MSKAEPKVGSRSPLPGGAKQRGGNFALPEKPGAAARRKVAEDDRPGVDPQVSLDPKRTLKLREEKAGYAAGGAVRGTGCATKGLKGAQ